MGRGRHYGLARRSLDAVERVVYGAGWAARLAYGLGLGSLTDPRLLDAAAAIVAFCGHTHGGQVATPSGWPIVLPHGAGARDLARGGVFERNGGQLLVSRGVGLSDVPVRLFAPSEVHLCTMGVE